MSEPHEQGGEAREAEAAVLDARIAAALERRPQPAMPYGFAARVARAAAAQQSARALPASHWGPRTAIVGAVLLILMMFAVALRRAHGAGDLWVQAGAQTLFLAEFVAALYAVARWKRARG